MRRTLGLFQPLGWKANAFNVIRFLSNYKSFHSLQNPTERDTDKDQKKK
jgi:hypothetical protein